jgi:hypothetical protein
LNPFRLDLIFAAIQDFGISLLGLFAYQRGDAGKFSPPWHFGTTRAMWLYFVDCITVHPTVEGAKSKRK